MPAFSCYNATVKVWKDGHGNRRSARKGAFSRRKGGGSVGVIQRAVDGVVAVISPQKALERAQARRQLQRQQVTNTGYSYYGANTYKKELAGWAYQGGSSREDIEDNLDILRQRSRDLYMGVPLATGAIKTMRTNVVGRGLKLKPTIDREVLGMEPEAAQALERRIIKEWELWADTPDCDAARVDNFCELQQLAFMSWLLSGDCLAMLPVKPRRGQPYDLRVRLIEADRLSSPGGYDTLDDRIIGGVETDSTGEVIAYHFSKHHPLSLASQPMEWVRVSAYGEKTGRRNVIHIMSRERIDQRRGVPFLAPVIEALKQLGRYTDAELVAAVVSGLFAVFVEREETGDDMEGAVGSNVPDEDRIDDEDETTVELAPGAVIDLQPGEKANATSPGRPNANFSGFVEAICRQIGAALEIPYELLLKHFTASYSASRGALEEAWKMFKMYRTWLANDFCQVIYEEWLAEAVAKGRINAPGFFSDPLYKKAYSKAEWNGPARGILDPVKEVTAAEKRVKNGFSTRQSETMEMTGSDYYANVEQLKQEEEKLREATQNAAGSQQPAAGADGKPVPGDGK